MESGVKTKRKETGVHNKVEGKVEKERLNRPWWEYLCGNELPHKGKSGGGVLRGQSGGKSHNNRLGGGNGVRGVFDKFLRGAKRKQFGDGKKKKVPLTFNSTWGKSGA